MARSEAMKRAQKKYQEKLERKNAVPRRVFKLSFHNQHDEDVIAHLEEQANVNGYIKELVRKDMNKQG